MQDYSSSSKVLESPEKNRGWLTRRRPSRLSNKSCLTRLSLNHCPLTSEDAWFQWSFWSNFEFNCSLRWWCIISCRCLAGLAIWLVMHLYMLLGHGLGYCHTKLQLGKELIAFSRIWWFKLYKSNCVPKLSLKVIMLMLAECCYHDAVIQCNDSEQTR